MATASLSGASNVSATSSEQVSANPPPQIFHGIKFFIQKDLNQQVQTDLCETIAALGGRVETKVPRSGYVLIQHGSDEAVRLQQCWRAKDRPERYFVHYTYVEACKSAGTLIKQLFLVDGEPITMHIHSSVKNVNARALLTERILHSGGEPTSSIQDAQVILADPTTEVFHTLCKTHSSIPDKYIEPLSWVKKVVDEGVLKFTPLVWKNPGGRRAGEERTPFTKEDEQHLCQWIATQIPYKSTGGRTGNKLYQHLCERVNEPEFAWANRHTWQSWRERYKKNATRLDPVITAIVEKNGIKQGEKGQHNFVRMPYPEESVSNSSKKKRPRRGTQDSQDNSAPLAPIPMAAFSSVMNADQPTPQPSSAEGTQPVLVSQMMVNSQLLPFPTPLPPPPPPPSDPPQTEVNDDEWPECRIGNDPPPAWSNPGSSKRRAEDVDEQEPRKRARTDASEIAKTYRFTQEEVLEWLTKYEGNVERTRRRFAEMRKLANSVSDDF